jgi:ATPase, YjeE family
MKRDFQILSESEANTMNIAKTIASVFKMGDVIVLEGDLGAGKTHFVKGFADGVNSKNVVTSPTFSIANFYKSPVITLLHIDLYRINTLNEFYDLGLIDYFDQSVTMIEWGMKFEDFVDEFLLISIEIRDDNTRSISFESKGDKYNSIIDNIEDVLTKNQVC